MATARSTSSRRNTKRRERKHVLSVNVLTPRIIAHSLLKKSRRLFIYTIVTLLLVFLTWGIFKSARHIFIEGERFMLTEIQLSPEPGEKSFLNYYNLPVLTGLDCGISIFSYDLAEIEASLRKFPEIKEASLTRRLPGTILLEVEERTPIAKLRLNGKNLMVDKEGYCFQSSLASVELMKDLPIILHLYKHDDPLQPETQQLSDTGLQRALHLVETWNAYNVGEALLSIEVKNYHSLEAITQTGASLIFGYYEHERQVRDYCALRVHSQSTGQEVVSANLLPFKNIPVKFDKKVLPSLSAPKKPIYREQMTPSIEEPPEEDVLLILEQG